MNKWRFLVPKRSGEILMPFFQNCTLPVKKLRWNLISSPGKFTNLFPSKLYSVPRKNNQKWQWEGVFLGHGVRKSILRGGKITFPGWMMIRESLITQLSTQWDFNDRHFAKKKLLAIFPNIKAKGVVHWTVVNQMSLQKKTWKNIIVLIKVFSIFM